jgi:uncharacterized membrane protein YedE/YeeE
MGHLEASITPLPALAGGAIIGLAASGLMFLLGQVAGISGMVTGLLTPVAGQWPWRGSFIAGLFAGGGIWAALDPSVFGAIPRPLPVIALAGVIVGYGVSLGGGCTSGHGVCGISRLSRRSIAATFTFMASGIVTAAVWRLLVGAVR